MSIFGSCNDMEIRFVNKTDRTLIVPQEGHRVRNPDSIEEWNDFDLGHTISHLAPGQSKSSRQTLSIKCIDDAQFEIHYSSTNGQDFTQLFESVNITDKLAVLSLTHG